MNPGDLQLTGLAHIHKLNTATLQQIGEQNPFAALDALTPDEPIWAWRVAKRLLAALVHVLTAPRGETRRQPTDFIYET